MIIVFPSVLQMTSHSFFPVRHGTPVNFYCLANTRHQNFCKTIQYTSLYIEGDVCTQAIIMRVTFVR